MRKLNATVLLFIPVLTAPFALQAQQPAPHCSLEGVAGVYGFNEDSPSGARGLDAAVALVGLLDLRPNGAAAVRYEVFSARAEGRFQSEVVNGVWSVQADCSGEIDFEPFTTVGGENLEQTFLFVAVDDGNELFFVRDNPREEGDAKRLFPRRSGGSSSDDSVLDALNEIKTLLDRIAIRNGLRP